MNRRTLAIAAAMTCTTAAVVALGATITADIAQGDNLQWDVENPDFSFTVGGGSGTITAHTNVYETIGFLPMAVSGGNVYARRLRDWALGAGPSFSLRLAADCDNAGHNCDIVGTDTLRDTWTSNPSLKIIKVNHHLTLGGGETASAGDRISLTDAHTGFHADTILAGCSVANGRTQFRGGLAPDATVLSSDGESCVNVIESATAATESCYGTDGEEYRNAFEVAAEGFGDPGTGHHVFYVESIAIDSGTQAGVRFGRNWTLVSVTANGGSSTARARTLTHEWGHVMGLAHVTGAANCTGTAATSNLMCAPSGQLMTAAQCTSTFNGTTFPDLR